MPCLVETIWAAKINRRTIGIRNLAKEQRRLLQPLGGIVDVAFEELVGRPVRVANAAFRKSRKILRVMRLKRAVVEDE